MEKIIPRWEWRTFADSIDIAVDLNQYTQDREVESAEVYVLSTVVDENPKVRDGKMDVKSLQQVNEDGLEQWKPILKVSFPLNQEQLAEVYRVFRLSLPKLKGDTVSFEEFVKLAEANSRLMAIDVVKSRKLYTVDGCIVENAFLTVDGKKFQTVAAEDPDPELVKDVVKKLGLWDRENINYVKGLKRIRNKEL